MKVILMVPEVVINQMYFQGLQVGINCLVKI